MRGSFCEFIFIGAKAKFNNDRQHIEVTSEHDLNPFDKLEETMEKQANDM